MSRTPALKIALLAAIALGIAAAVAIVKFRRTAELADQTTNDIEAQLNALDPVARADVLAKLARDAAKDIKAKRN